MFRMYGHRRTLTPAETKANADKRTARAMAAMSCQCCTGKILANTGVIAHHGYQRPGDGWQTASCFGARRLPFEVDRTALGELIVALKNSLSGARATLRDIKAEKHPISHEFTDYTAQRDHRGHWPSIKIEFSRAGFADQIKTHEKLLRSNGYHTITFDDEKKRAVDWQAYKVKQIAEDVRRSQARYDGWKPTHVWVPGPAGVKLMPPLAVDKGALGGWQKVSPRRAAASAALYSQRNEPSKAGT